MRTDTGWEVCRSTKGNHPCAPGTRALPETVGHGSAMQALQPVSGCGVISSSVICAKTSRRTGASLVEAPDHPSTVRQADLSDNALDARSRLEQAVAVLGPDLSGVVLDVCCFLKGLEGIERERRWPPRSAKLMLRTGLDLLAAHYGTRAGRAGLQRCGSRRNQVDAACAISFMRPTMERRPLDRCGVRCSPKTDIVKDRLFVGANNVLWRAVGKQGQCNRHETTDDVSVGSASKRPSYRRAMGPAPPRPD